MKTPFLLPLLFLVSCGTTLPLSTGKFKTYADIEALTVTDGAVSLTMTGVKHSAVNQAWAATIGTALSDGIKTIRHALMVGAVVDAANAGADLARDRMVSKAAVRQAEIGAGTRAAELKAANEALRITAPAN